MSAEHTTETEEAVDGFDFGAWLSGAKKPERSVTVYGRADLVAELEELEEQLQAARNNPVHDDRLASTGTPQAIASKIARLQEQMRDSAHTFRFRALDQATVRGIYAAAPQNEDGEYDADHVQAEWVAAACVAPAITPEQARQLQGAIGAGQFALLWDAAFAATNQKRVSVPFSLAASLVNSEDSSTS